LPRTGAPVHIVVRALLIVSEASRAIPEPLKEKHADIRWIGVRDIGNMLCHHMRRYRRV
jgi:uncharacterized protein with HEPN domain